MKEINWTFYARQNIQDIYDYIAKDSVYYAGNFVDALIERGERIAEFPESGRIVPEKNDPAWREVFHESYRIIYKIDTDKINIIQVRHMAQFLRFDDKI